MNLTSIRVYVIDIDFILNATAYVISNQTINNYINY